MQAVTNCMKGLFLIFNFVFWVTGLGLLITGILVKYTFSYMIKLSTNINYNLAPYIMIGCGVFIILIGFMGCWASIKEHGWALKIYMFVLVLLFLVEIGGAIAGYVLKGKLSKGLKDGMDNAVGNYYTNDDSKSAMDQVQEKIVKCCGVSNYTDYFNGKTCATVSKNETLRVPVTCCKSEDRSGCQYKDICKAAGDLGIYENGCYDQLLKEAKEKFLIIGGVALGIAGFQILGVLCAYVLTKKFQSNSKYENF